MSHAALILNLTKPCVKCGEPRQNKYMIKCLDCAAQESPVTEADIERIIREYDDPLPRT